VLKKLKEMFSICQKTINQESKSRFSAKTAPRLHYFNFEVVVGARFSLMVNTLCVCYTHTQPGYEKN